MNRLSKIAFCFLMGLTAFAGAQDTGTLGNWSICFDPDPDFDPFSDDFGINGLGNSLMEVTIGGSGTVNWDGQNGQCFDPDITLDVAGRMGFRIGPLGSRQSDFDDNLVTTMGWPFQGGNWSAAVFRRNGANAGFFGADGLSLFFDGASDRYIIAEGTTNDIRCRLRIDLVGDAVRASYTMTNLLADPATLGMWWGQWVAMMTRNVDIRGFNGPNPYVFLPGRKPLIVETAVDRASNPSNFPGYVNFNFSQSNPYGLQVLMSQNETTFDETGQSDLSSASAFKYGNKVFLHGGVNANPPFNDSDPLDITIGTPAYTIKYDERTVPAGGNTTFVQYFKSTWSYANYARPYAVVLDAPRLLNASTGAGSLNGLSPNPMVIRVYVDNIRGYTTINEEVPLNEVRVTLNLDPKTGLRLASGQASSVIIDRIGPREIRFVDFRVQATGKTFGGQPFSATVAPTPGPVKTVNGMINIAATPRLDLRPKANMITIPFRFTNTSLQTVLGLKSPTEFQAFTFSPQQRGYVLQTNVQRGKGYWVVYNGTTTREIALAGNPTTPPDSATGAPNIVLKSGWNMIGNPYNYSFPLGQMVGVSGSNPGQAATWDSLVQQGIVGGTLAYWDNTTGNGLYRYLEGSDALMAPMAGYWIFVNTSEDLTLSFPPVYTEGLPGSSREKGGVTLPNPVYRLKLSAQINKDVDDSVILGQVREAPHSNLLNRAKPPKAPGQAINAFITGNGNQEELAHAFKFKGNQSFNYVVENEDAGIVRITWPNANLIPSNLDVTITDPATKVIRNLKQFPTFAYLAQKGARKTFRIDVKVKL